MGPEGSSVARPFPPACASGVVQEAEQHLDVQEHPKMYEFGFQSNIASISDITKEWTFRDEREVSRCAQSPSDGGEQHSTKEFGRWWVGRRPCQHALGPWLAREEGLDSIVASCRAE
jgi:hypothetical protein